MSSLSIILYSNQIEESIAFYKRLGFEVVNQIGTNEWVMLSFEQCTLMLSKPVESIEFVNPTFTGSIYFNVQNCAQIWERVSSWAIIEYPMQDFDYGMREFAIRDTNGYLLQFGEELG